MLDRLTPVVWRGPMVTNLLRQFFFQVDWGELDILLLDLPPGTGDTHLTLIQYLEIQGGVIVTTPQEVALLDVRRGIRMFRDNGVPIIGVIENMSGFTCPHCGHHDDIFTTGGGEATARDYDVPFLGRIPLDPQVSALSDAGDPVVLRHPESEAGQQFLAIARRLAEGPARSSPLAPA